MKNIAAPAEETKASPVGAVKEEACVGTNRAKAIISGSYTESVDNDDGEPEIFECEQSSNSTFFLLDVDRFNKESQVWLLASIVYALDRVARRYGLGFVHIGHSDLHKTAILAPELKAEMLPFEKVIWAALEKDLAVAHQSMAAPKSSPARRARYAKKWIESGESMKWILLMRQALIDSGYVIAHGSEGISQETGILVARKLWKAGLQMYPRHAIRTVDLLHILVREVNEQGYHFSRWEPTRFVPSLDLQYIEEVLAREEARAALDSEFRVESRVIREMRNGQAAMRLMSFLTALKSQGYSLARTEVDTE